MSLIPTLIGWCVIAAVLAVPLGKFINRRRANMIKIEDWDPAPRTLSAPHVPPQQPWQPSDTDLNDPREDPRDTPPA